MKRNLTNVLVAAGVALGVMVVSTQPVAASYPPVACSAAKSITITGERVVRAGKAAIKVTGTASCLAGQQLTPRFRLPGQTSFFEGSARPVVQADGSFILYRNGTKRISVYFTGGDVRSNTIVIASR